MLPTESLRAMCHGTAAALEAIQSGRSRGTFTPAEIRTLQSQLATYEEEMRRRECAVT